MSIEKMSAEELLGVDKFNVDEDEAHIVIRYERCLGCSDKPCLFVCPAQCYKLLDGKLGFDYVGCLECGTCRLACRQLGNGGVTTWTYPRGTFGVSYRCG
jgi:ferredoxin like protein